jgi:hypothetical protein
MRPQHKLVAALLRQLLDIYKKEDYATIEDIEFFKDTRLSVIDEFHLRRTRQF